MSLSVEVTLIASTANFAGVTPVANGRPVDLFFVFLLQLSHVDICGEHSIGSELALVNQHLEEQQVSCTC